MTKYVFDTGVFINLFRYYYRKRFPTLWEKFDLLVNESRIFSVREVFKEFEKKDDDILEWAKKNSVLFKIPNTEELQFIREIFQNQHFQILVSEKVRGIASSSADGFLIASAKIHDAVLVTTEKYKPNSAKIPNVCEHFKIPCIDLEEFMEQESWEF
jgi:predicted nucleic acid-binding protein